MLDTPVKVFDIGAQVIFCGHEPTIHQHDEVESKTSHELFDYSGCDPTPDQLDINAFISQQQTADVRILHVGIGNSSIAAQVKDAKLIKGITLSENELRLSQTLGMEYYDTHLLNKYSLAFNNFVRDQQFDFIMDNNLSSFACCQTHFLRYMAQLSACLSEGGMIVTHWLGMQWVLDLGIGDTEVCWRLDEEKLSYIAHHFGLKVNNFHPVYTLTKAVKA